ncbi:MAG: YraN family protein [Flavobacteriaceae bacterium]|nr:YraN family protein [Flavobacteriaceae bacterium]
MATHNETGHKGEAMAARFLVEKGYKILARNYTFQKAEVDIIAQKDDILAVVEVKTRSTADFGTPESFVNKKKIGLLVRAIDQFVIENDLDVSVRFDIVGIVIKPGEKPTLHHLEDAFYFFE